MSHANSWHRPHWSRSSLRSRQGGLLAIDVRRGGYDLVYRRVDTAEAMRAAPNTEPWDAIVCDYSLPGFGALRGLQAPVGAGFRRASPGPWLMFKNRTTYTEFLRAEEGIATNILADRLVRLEEDGIIARDERPGAGVSYRLTPKGIELLPVMTEIIGWSAKHDPRTAADKGFARRLRTDRRGLLAELRADLQGRRREERT